MLDTMTSVLRFADLVGDGASMSYIFTGTARRVPSRSLRPLGIRACQQLWLFLTLALMVLNCQRFTMTTTSSVMEQGLSGRMYRKLVLRIGRSSCWALMLVSCILVPHRNALYGLGASVLLISSIC